MTTKLLWSINRWGEDNQTEIDAAGPDVSCIFGRKPAEVTDEQWEKADAMISVPDSLPADQFHKIPNCKILVTPKVGFDNIDLVKYGAAGFPVCNVPD